MRKKVLSILLSMVMVTGLTVGCSNSNDDEYTELKEKIEQLEEENSKLKGKEEVQEKDNNIDDKEKDEEEIEDEDEKDSKKEKNKKMTTKEIADALKLQEDNDFDDYIAGKNSITLIIVDEGYDDFEERFYDLEYDEKSNECEVMAYQSYSMRLLAKIYHDVINKAFDEDIKIIMEIHDTDDNVVNAYDSDGNVDGLITELDFDYDEFDGVKKPWYEDLSYWSPVFEDDEELTDEEYEEYIDEIIDELGLNIEED